MLLMSYSLQTVVCVSCGGKISFLSLGNTLITFCNLFLINNKCIADNFGFKQEERFDCGAKSVDVYPSQRRFPQPLFWDYKVHRSSLV